MTLHKTIEQLSSELAEELVEHRMGEHMVWEDREDGSEGFTEEAQDLFCELQSIIQHHLWKGSK